MNSMLRAKNFALVAGMTILLTLPFANTVVADSGFRAYNYYAGGGFLCTLDASFCPDVALAMSNGDTVSISGAGTLTIHPDSVTGSGTFVHKDSPGNVKV